MFERIFRVNIKIFDTAELANKSSSCLRLAMNISEGIESVDFIYLCEKYVSARFERKQLIVKSYASVQHMTDWE